MGFFAGLRQKRRERAVREHPLPDDSWQRVITGHAIFKPLSEIRTTRLRWLVTAFMREKRFVMAHGAHVEDEGLMFIAAQACLPVLELGLDGYRDMNTIIVVPGGYTVSDSRALGGGAREEYEDELSGEVLSLGPVVLSWDDVEDSGQGDGYNVVIHEAAHKLDARDGTVDGTPVLPETMSYKEWNTTFTRALEDLRERLRVPDKRRIRGKAGAVKRGQGIDDYAAEDPGEFFAVCCEFFFDRPSALAREFPGVFALLERYFGYSMM